MEHDGAIPQKDEGILEVVRLALSIVKKQSEDDRSSSDHKNRSPIKEAPSENGDHTDTDLNGDSTSRFASLMGKPWSSVDGKRRSMDHTPNESKRPRKFFASLKEADATMFPLKPLEDELRLVKCLHCGKIVQLSGFCSHLDRCPKTPDLPGFDNEIAMKAMKKRNGISTKISTKIPAEEKIPKKKKIQGEPKQKAKKKEKAPSTEPKKTKKTKKENGKDPNGEIKPKKPRKKKEKENKDVDIETIPSKPSLKIRIPLPSSKSQVENQVENQVERRPINMKFSAVLGSQPGQLSFKLNPPKQTSNSIQTNFPTGNGFPTGNQFPTIPTNGSINNPQISPISPNMTFPPNSPNGFPPQMPFYPPLTSQQYAQFVSEMNLPFDYSKTLMSPQQISQLIASMGPLPFGMMQIPGNFPLNLNMVPTNLPTMYTQMPFNLNSNGVSSQSMIQYQNPYEQEVLYISQPPSSSTLPSRLPGGFQGQLSGRRQVNTSTQPVGNIGTTTTVPPNSATRIVTENSGKQKFAKGSSIPPQQTFAADGPPFP